MSGAVTSAPAVSWSPPEASSGGVRPATAAGGGGPTGRRPAGRPPRLGRIGDRATFGDLRRRGRRARAGVVTVTWVPGEPPARVAYAVGRAVGSAVGRNRVRRRLRALVAEAADELRPGAYLVGAGPRAAEASYQQLGDDLRGALRQLRGEAG